MDEEVEECSGGDVCRAGCGEHQPRCCAARANQAAPALISSTGSKPGDHEMPEPARGPNIRAEGQKRPKKLRVKKRDMRRYQ